MICQQAILFFRNGLAALFGLVVLAPSAHAEMVLSQVIIDMKPGANTFQDIEVYNDGDERLFVAVVPVRIKDPGLSSEARQSEPDPSALGLLVSPQRLVLEPNQRRVVRVAAIGERGATDKVYRVAIKPVAGALSAPSTALKVLVGYDALVLIRPKAIAGGVTATRQGRRITFHNGSNTAQEIYDGKQCVAGQTCVSLPARRVYAGADWSVDLPEDAPVEFTVSDGSRSGRSVFP